MPEKKKEKKDDASEPKKPAESKNDSPQFISVEHLRKVTEEKRKELDEQASEKNKKMLHDWAEAWVKHIKAQALIAAEKGRTALIISHNGSTYEFSFVLMHVLRDIGFRVYTISNSNKYSEYDLFVAWD